MRVKLYYTLTTYVLLTYFCLEIYYADTHLTFLIVFIDFFVSYSGNPRGILHLFLLEDSPSSESFDETEMMCVQGIIVQNSQLIRSVNQLYSYSTYNSPEL